MNVKKGWIPVKEDPDLQIKHKETKPVIIKQVDEHHFQIDYSEGQTAQFGRDGKSICNYQVPLGKKFEVQVKVIITDK